MNFNNIGQALIYKRRPKICIKNGKNLYDGWTAMFKTSERIRVDKTVNKDEGLDMEFCKLCI